LSRGCDAVIVLGGLPERPAATDDAPYMLAVTRRDGVVKGE